MKAKVKYRINERQRERERIIIFERFIGTSTGVPPPDNRSTACKNVKGSREVICDSDRRRVGSSLLASLINHVALFCLSPIYRLHFFTDTESLLARLRPPILVSSHPDLGNFDISERIWISRRLFIDPIVNKHLLHQQISSRRAGCLGGNPSTRKSHHEKVISIRVV